VVNSSFVAAFAAAVRAILLLAERLITTTHLLVKINFKDAYADAASAVAALNSVSQAGAHG
jgi:hypothetical protein